MAQTNYQQAKEANLTDDQIKDAFLEKYSDNFQKAKEAGLSDDEIYAGIEEKHGIPRYVFESEPTQDDAEYSFLADTAKAVEQYAYRKESELRGAARPVLGFVRAIQDSMEAAGAETKDIIDITDWVSDNEDRISELMNKMKIDPNSFSNPAMVGELAATALPLAKLSKMRTILPAETAVAGAAEYGSGSTPAEALTAAGVTGATIAVGTPVAAWMIKGLGRALSGKEIGIIENLFKGRATEDEAYDFLVRKSGMTDKKVDDAISTYAESIGKKADELTYQEKTTALLNNTEFGSKVLADAKYYDDAVLSAQNKSDEELRQILASKTETGDFEWSAVALKEFGEDSAFLYGRTKNVLLDHFNNDVVIPDNAVNDLVEVLTQSSMKADDQVIVKRVIDSLKNQSDAPLNVEKLLAMKQDLNQLNLKGTQAYKAGQVGDLIDDSIKQGIGDEGYSIWKEVNKRYAQKIIMEKDHPIGKLLAERLKKNANLSEKELAEEIVNIRGKGFNTFNSLRDALGEEVSSAVEKEIVNTLVKKNGAMADAIDEIQKFEFRTVEGRGLQQELDRIKALVPDRDADKLLNAFIDVHKTRTGWSDNIISKAKYHWIGKLWDGIMKRTAGGEAERVMTRVSDMLKDGSAKIELNVKDGKKFQEWFEEERVLLSRKIDDLEAKGKSSKDITNMKSLVKELEKAKNKIKMMSYKPKQKQVLGEYKTTSTGKMSEAGTVEKMAPREVSGSERQRPTGRASTAKGIVSSMERTGSKRDQIQMLDGEKGYIYGSDQRRIAGDTGGLKGSTERQTGVIERPREVTGDYSKTSKIRVGESGSVKDGTRRISGESSGRKTTTDKKAGSVVKMSEDAKAKTKEVVSLNKENSRLSYELKQVDKSNLSKQKKEKKKLDLKAEIRKNNAIIAEIKKKMPKN